jgi:hypothetical protein
MNLSATLRRAELKTNFFGALLADTFGDLHTPSIVEGSIALIQLLLIVARTRRIQYFVCRRTMSSRREKLWHSVTFTTYM